LLFNASTSLVRVSIFSFCAESSALISANSPPPKGVEVCFMEDPSGVEVSFIAGGGLVGFEVLGVEDTGSV
jgi:hypothetical protein